MKLSKGAQLFVTVMMHDDEMALVHNLNAPTRPGLYRTEVQNDTPPIKAPEMTLIHRIPHDRTGIQFCCGSAEYLHL